MARSGFSWSLAVVLVRRDVDRWLTGAERRAMGRGYLAGQRDRFAALAEANRPARFTHEPVPW